MSGNAWQTSIRFVHDPRDRVDALMELMQAEERFRHVRVTRSLVIQMAVDRGLADFEREYGIEAEE